MFEEFSAGYYLGRLYVQPYAGDCAVIPADQHERANEQVYDADSTDGEALPLVMKLGRRHFAVRGEAGVPSDTLAVPPDLLDDVEVRNAPSEEQVLLAKEGHARRLFDMGAV